MTTISTIITKVTSRSYPLAGGDASYELSPGEHFEAEVATGVTLTVLVPTAEDSPGALCEIKHIGDAGTVLIVPKDGDRGDNIDRFGTDGMQFGPPPAPPAVYAGYECVCLRAGEDASGWVIVGGVGL
jgi:hypothetical protein